MKLDRIVGYKCQSLSEIVILLFLIGAADEGKMKPKTPSKLMTIAYHSASIFDKAVC
jgi:hypothetical protein